jgi:cytochrome b
VGQADATWPRLTINNHLVIVCAFPKEVRLSNKVRQFHRWVSVAFTLGVITYMVAMSGGSQPPGWVGLFALFPLILLLITGLYLFFLPYWRRRQPTS